MPVYDAATVKFDETPAGGTTYDPATVQFDQPKPSFWDKLKRPFVSQAATAAEAVNKGVGAFSQGLSDVAGYIADKTGTEKGGVFDRAVQFYAENADYWHQKAQEVGTNGVDSLIGDAVGGAVPGVAEFMLNVPYASLKGAAEAHKQGNSEALGAIKEGAKRALLGGIFHATGELSRPLQAGAMGATMAAQTAGEGGSLEDVAKAAGTGLLYGATGPRGKVGLKEIREGLRPEAKLPPGFVIDEPWIPSAEEAAAKYRDTRPTGEIVTEAMNAPGKSAEESAQAFQTQAPTLRQAQTGRALNSVDTLKGVASPAEEAAQTFTEQGNIPPSPSQSPLTMDMLRQQYQKGETLIPEKQNPWGASYESEASPKLPPEEDVAVPQVLSPVEEIPGQLNRGGDLNAVLESGGKVYDPAEVKFDEEVIPSGKEISTQNANEGQQMPDAGQEEVAAQAGPGPSGGAAPVLPKPAQNIPENIPAFTGSMSIKGPKQAGSVNLTQENAFIPGERVQLGKSPQTHTVLRELEPTAQEKQLGERYFEVKNDRTGEVQTVERKDIRGQGSPLDYLTNQEGAILNPIETIRKWRESRKPDEELAKLRGQYLSDVGDISKKEKASMILTGKDTLKDLFKAEPVKTSAKDITDAKLAQLIMERQRYKDVQWKAAEERRKWWDKEPDESRYAFMMAVDQGGQLPGEIGRLAREYRSRLDKVFNDESAAGLDVNYLKDYFPRDWEQPEKIMEWLNQKINSMGSDKYTKERYYELMKDALKEGFRLKDSNPEAAVLKREFAANRAITGEEFMNDLAGSGLAVLDKDAEKLNKNGWDRVTLNGKNWLIKKEISPVVQNALLSPSLWQRDDIFGKAFRAFNEVKNTLIPIKLGLSGFHLLHIATMTAPQRRAVIYEYLLKGGKPYDGMVKDLVKASTFTDQGFMKGSDLVKAWEAPDKDLNEYQKQAVQHMQEGGFSPKMSEVWRMNAIETFNKALDEGKYITATVKGARALIEATQKPLFEKYIPAIKTAAYVNEVEMLMRRKPELMNDAEARGVELRKIAKSIDNRFGELNYSTLFWNKYLKEIGIASSLSMGWNLGFIREYGGAAMDTAKAVRNLVQGQGSREDITRRMLFTLDYTIQSAMIGGMITAGFLAIKQNMPWDKIAEALGWKDFLYPRTGDANLDGSQERMNTPFYTKEFPAMTEHIRKEGYVGGPLAYLRNKANPIITSLANVWSNRDFYGQEIRSENDPFVKQAVDVAKYLGGEAGPISLTSFRSAAKTDSVIKYTSFAGFAKAPGYITKTPMQNEIGDLYEKRFGGATKPKEDKEKDDAKKEIKSLYYKGKNDEANAKLDEAVEKGYIKERGVNAFIAALDVPTDIMLFKRLPESDQKALLQKMNYEDMKRYIWYAKEGLRDDIESLNKNGRKLLKLFAAGLVKEPEWKMGRNVSSTGRSMSAEVDDEGEQPGGSGKVLDETTAGRYYDEAKGDVNEARRRAIADGWEIPSEE